MRSFASVVFLLVVLDGIQLSKQENCWKYGNCDPGLNCENYPLNDLTAIPRCLKCCDGGFISWDRENNGKKDCRSGIDEWEMIDCRKSNCNKDSDCCSGYCVQYSSAGRVGKCWNALCGFIKGRNLNTCCYF